MKRLLTSALAAALVAAGTGSEAQAQDMMTRRVSLFDLGLYAGGAYTTPWFEINDEGFAPGFSSIFGVTATYWATPGIGIRYHTAYFPTDLPEGDDTNAGGVGDSDLVMNNYFFDLNLAFRPWIARTDMGNLMGSMYFFLGGGALLTNIAGDQQARPGFEFSCINRFETAGICLSDDPEYATVGQGNIGLGFDLFPLTSTIGLFAEAAVHGYDSPAHNVGGENNRFGEDRFAFTPRLVAGLKFAFGDLTPPPPPPPPLPPVAPQPPVVVEERPMQDIQVCVIQDGTLTTVTGQFNPTTGDTTVAGRRFSEAYPAMGPTYAAGATWFINNEPITIGNDRYVRFGLPRVIGTTEVTRMGDFQGTPIFVEAGMTGTPEVVYVPVRPGCEFQPYQRQEAIKVRG